MKVAEAYIDIRTDLNRLRAELNEAHRRIDQFSKKSARSVGMLQSAFTRLIGPAVGLYAIRRATMAVVSAQAEFSKQISMVSTMLDTKTMPLLEGMRDSLLSLSREWGESTATLSKGLYDIISAGVDASRATNVLREAVLAAKAGFTTTAVSSDALTTMLKAYGLEAHKITMINDMMFAAVRAGKTNYAQLANSLGNVASIAALSSVSMEELFAAISTITRAGISASEATTALTGLLQAFLDPQEDAIEASKRLGIELSTNTLNTEGLLGVVKKLQNATSEDINVLAGRIRGFKALATLVQDQAGFEKDLASQLNSEGEAAKAAGKATDNLATSIDRLKSSWDVMLKSPEGIGGVIGMVVNRVARDINMLSTGRDIDLNPKTMEASANYTRIWNKWASRRPTRTQTRRPFDPDAYRAMKERQAAEEAEKEAKRRAKEEKKAATEREKATRKAQELAREYSRTMIGGRLQLVDLNADILGFGDNQYEAQRVRARAKAERAQTALDVAWSELDPQNRTNAASQMFGELAEKIGMVLNAELAKIAEDESKPTASSRGVQRGGWGPRIARGFGERWGAGSTAETLGETNRILLDIKREIKKQQVGLR